MTDYFYRQTSAGEFFPIIDIITTYKNRSVRILALIDSGATTSIFKTDVADALRIPVVNGKELYLGGVGGRIKGYSHKINLTIAEKTITAPVVFSHEYTVSFNLIGRSGIFNRFVIAFDEASRTIKLN